MERYLCLKESNVIIPDEDVESSSDDDDDDDGDDSDDHGGDHEEEEDGDGDGDNAEIEPEEADEEDIMGIAVEAREEDQPPGRVEQEVNLINGEAKPYQVNIIHPT